MNPEIDKLASAALDGEATAQELARYETDPDFLAAKDELGMAAEFVAQSGAPEAPEGLARAQISVAMEQFRADAAQRAVIAAQPVPASTRHVAKEPRWGFPRWFAPAILSVAVLGGVGIAAQNFSGGSDTDEAGVTTTFAAMDNGLRAESATAGDGDDAMDDQEASALDGAQPATVPETTEAMEEDADIAGGEDFEFERPDPIDLTGATYVAAQSVEPAEAAELATKTPPMDPADYERCGVEHGYFPPPGELVLAVPFRIDNEPVEVLVYDTGLTGGKTAQIVDEQCKVLSES